MPWPQATVQPVALVRPLWSAALIALGCAGIAFLISLVAFSQWYEQFGVRPDFGTNGLLWYSTAALTFHLTLYPLFLIAVLVLAASLHVRRHGALPRPIGLCSLSAIATAALYGVFFWGTPWLPFAATAIPPVLMSALAALLYGQYQTSRLGRSGPSSEYRSSLSNDYEDEDH